MDSKASRFCHVDKNMKKFKVCDAFNDKFMVLLYNNNTLILL